MTICTVAVIYRHGSGSSSILSSNSSSNRRGISTVSWEVRVNGLPEEYVTEMLEKFPSLQLLPTPTGPCLTVTQTINSFVEMYSSEMGTITGYLNWFDGKGFKVVGAITDTFTSEIHPGNQVKAHIYTLQSAA